MISADQTTVTFRPDAGLESIKHPFWKPTKHDGTRLYIYGSDLSSLKTGEYSQSPFEDHILYTNVTGLLQDNSLAMLSRDTTIITLGYKNGKKVLFTNV